MSFNDYLIAVAMAAVCVVLYYSHYLFDDRFDSNHELLDLSYANCFSLIFNGDDSDALNYPINCQLPNNITVSITKSIGRTLVCW